MCYCDCCNYNKEVLYKQEMSVFAIHNDNIVELGMVQSFNKHNNSLSLVVYEYLDILEKCDNILFTLLSFNRDTEQDDWYLTDQEEHKYKVKYVNKEIYDMGILEYTIVYDII